jgi:hypothetical protein
MPTNVLGGTSSTLDGSLVAQVDMRTPLQEELQAVIFSSTGLTPGGHTLTIEVMGRNNEPPGATVDAVFVDAFDRYSGETVGSPALTGDDSRRYHLVSTYTIRTPRRMISPSCCVRVGITPEAVRCNRT